MSLVSPFNDDQDYQFMITRDEFYAQLTPIIERVNRPVLEALRRANLTQSTITEESVSSLISRLVIIGGSVRVPLVQQQLKRLVPTLGQSLNGDEAAAFGAAFRAANMSVVHRVRPLGFVDVSSMSYGVQVTPLSAQALPSSFEVEDSDKSAAEDDDTESTGAAASSSGSLYRRSVLFPAGHRLSKRKTVTFAVNPSTVEDLSVSLYSEETPSSGFKFVLVFFSSLSSHICCTVAVSPRTTSLVSPVSMPSSPTSRSSTARRRCR